MKVIALGRACTILSLLMSLSAMASAQAPVITKIDPPNWWAGMPRPMLLVQGENLAGAGFKLSDKSLRIEKTHVSANGHWAELWLKASPARPETVELTVSREDRSARARYTFDARREAGDGFAGFSSKDVMYLIMTDRFADGDLKNDQQPGDEAGQKEKPRGWHGGDLRGILQHLDYLQDLGVTTVWITPVYQNHEVSSYHGYGATDMYAVDEHYGSLDNLKTLAVALHRRGMKLVLDTVPNHVGPAHVWVDDSPEPDWFHGTKQHHRPAQGEFRPLVDPHAPWLTQKDVTQGWFADILPDLNQENPDVAQYLTQNAIWWTEEAGLDGLRLDTFPYVGRQFWNGYHAELHGLYPQLTTVGEVFNSDATITSAFAGGVTRSGIDTGLDTPFDFPTYFALRDVFLHGAPMSKLADILRLDALYPHPERLAPFLGNHDTTRFLSEPGATTARLKLAFAVLFTMRGMPQIYSGDEIAMSGGEDPDNRRDFPGGFSANKVKDFGPEDDAQKDMHDWVKRLLEVRRSQAGLQTGEEQILQADADTLIYVRGEKLASRCSGGSRSPRVLVLVNKGDRPVTITLTQENTALEGCHEAQSLWNKGAEAVRKEGSLLVTIPGGGVEIFRLD